MLRNYFVLNLMLVSVIALLGIRLHNVVTEPFHMPVEPTAVTPQEIEEKQSRKRVPIDSSSYEVIVSKNLFHPSRSETNKKPPEVTRAVSKNEMPQLFGTIITNEKKLAIFEDRTTKKSNLYKVNDSVSGFLVSQILANKVILKKGIEKIEVNLRADKKFKAPRRIQTSRKTIRKAPKRQRRSGRVANSRPQRRRAPARRSSR